MHNDGLSPNTVTYGALIAGWFLDPYDRFLDVQKIADSLDESASNFSLPNNIIYTIAIVGLCKFGKFNGARRMLSILLLKGLVPDNYTYCALIHVRALQSYGIPESAGSDVLKSASESIIDLAAIFAMLFGGELHVLHAKRFKFAPSQGSAAAETNPSKPLLSALEESIDGARKI
ncbi:hypothetical protein ACFE04_005465 [Oxalis oulophora]